MDRPTEIVPSASLTEFFKDMIEAARSHQRVTVQQSTEFYLVNLLSEYLTARGPAADAEPLAFMLKRAQEATGFERVRELKRLGDTSLYVSGFFGESLDHGLVDVDYYVSMGGRAYAVISETFQGQSGGAGSLYAELAQKFGQLVSLLAEVSERAALGTNQGLIKVYEKFLKTGSDRMARLLCEQGMLPMAKPGLVQ